MKIQLTHSILREFFSQLRFASGAQQKKYLTAAEKLMLIVDPQKEYPVDFVIFRITGKRLSGPHQDAMIAGRELIADLRVFITHFSERLELPAAAQPEPIHTVEELAGRFGVSSKTIRRWQQRGLSGRIYRFEDGRKRLGFAESSVTAFGQAHGELVQRAKRFSLLSYSEKRRIIELAKEIRSVKGGRREPVLREISQRLGRSRETVRTILMEYDRKHPDQPIFDTPFGRIGARERSQLCKLCQQGASHRELTERFGISRSSIHRIVNQRRAEELMRLKLSFIDSPEFYVPGAEKDLFQSTEAMLEELRSRPAGVLNRVQESGLFRCYNFLKFLAAAERDRLRLRHPSSRQMDRIDQCLRLAERVKNVLVEMNMPLVVSVAGRHLRSGASLNELVSEGNISLMRAVEKFDYTRGYRFSTYAGWAIAKDFARKIPAEAARPDRAYGSELDEFILEAKPADRAELSAVESAKSSLRETIEEELDERERFVVLNRFPVGEGVIPQKGKTLREIGDALGLSKERIRQIELQALQKLRHRLSPEQFDLLTG